jgi:hypothetical protein
MGSPEVTTGRNTRDAIAALDASPAGMSGYADIHNLTHPQETATTNTSDTRGTTGSGSHSDVAPPARTTDHSEVAANASTGLIPPQKNPFSHVQVALTALDELKTDAQKNLKDTDKVTYTDETGQEHSVDWKTRRTELQTLINDESRAAMNAADKLKQTGDDSVATQIAAFMKDKEPERVRLATLYGYDPKNLDEQALATKLSTMDQNDPQHADLLKLSQLQQEGDGWNMLSASPSVTRMMYANFLQMGALDDPDKPGYTPADNATSAFQLSREAGRLDKGNAVMGGYADEITQINQRFDELQTDRGRAVLEQITAATKATTPEDKEKAYQKAMEIAKGIDIPFLTGLLNDPRNAQNIDVKKGLLAQIVIVDNAAVEYGKFLSDQGKYDKATPLLLKAMSDFPDLFANDPSFNKALTVCMNGKDNLDKNPQVELAAFNKSMQDSKYDDAAKHLAATKKIAQDELAVMQKDQQGIAAERTQIQAKITALDTDTQHTDDEKKAEKARLQQELAGFDQFDAGVKAKQNLVGHCTYLEAYLDYVNGNNEASRNAIADFKQNYPDLAKSPDYKLAELEDEVRDRGMIGNFIHRNKANIVKYLCVGAGVIAGVAAAAATFYLGPGALVAGGAAGVAVTAGLALAIGTGAGALSYVGASKLAPGAIEGLDKLTSGDGTAAAGRAFSETFAKTHITGRTWLEGAGYGFAGAASYVSGGLLAELVPEGAAATGMAGKLWALLPKAGAGFAYGVTAHGSDELIQMHYDHKDGHQAFTDWWKGTAVDTLMFSVLPGGRVPGPGTAFKDAMSGQGVEAGRSALFNAQVWKAALSTAGEAALKPHNVRVGTPRIGRLPAAGISFNVPTVASDFGQIATQYGVAKGAAPQYLYPMVLQPGVEEYHYLTGQQDIERAQRDENQNLGLPDGPPDLDALPAQNDQR